MHTAKDNGTTSLNETSFHKREVYYPVKQIISNGESIRPNSKGEYHHFVKFFDHSDSFVISVYSIPNF